MQSLAYPLTSMNPEQPNSLQNQQPLVSDVRVVADAETLDSDQRPQTQVRYVRVVVDGQAGDSLEEFQALVGYVMATAWKTG